MRLRTALALTSTLCLFLPAPGRVLAAQQDLATDAKAALLIDARDGHKLFGFNEDEHLQIASLTKLMTALLTLERLKLGQTLTATSYSPQPAESQIGLLQGEAMSVDDLLKALLIESANDAAAALAAGVSGSTPSFVELMNKRALQLKMDNTHYANPIGFDDPENYSTARDLTALTRVLMRKPVFRQIVRSPEATLASGNHERVIENRNLLVGRYPFITGVKTGHTVQAGYSLVGSASSKGIKLVSVVLGTPSEQARDRDTLELFRYGLGQYTSHTALKAGKPYAQTSVEYRDGDVKLVAKHTIKVPLRRDQSYRLITEAREEVSSTKKGQPLGKIIVTIDGRKAGSEKLVAARATAKADLLDIFIYYLKKPLTILLLAVTLLISGLAVRKSRVRRVNTT